MDLEELSFEIDGQMNEGQKVITTIAHPEQSSSELKIHPKTNIVDADELALNIISIILEIPYLPQVFRQAGQQTG